MFHVFHVDRVRLGGERGPDFHSGLAVSEKGADVSFFGGPTSIVFRSCKLLLFDWFRDAVERCQ